MGSIIAAAESYLSRGWLPVPVKPKGKQPLIAGFQNLTPSDVDFVEWFTDENQNIALVLGSNSNGLVDIDLDDEMARRLAPCFLPQTGMRHGRSGSLQSHWWYIVQDPGRTQRFQDPGNKGVLVEYRAAGSVTVVPPSIHQTGEPILFDTESEPTNISRQELLSSVGKLAAASLLAHCWIDGGRHELALVLAGALAHGGWVERQTSDFIRAICYAANDDERDDRLCCVRTSYQQFEHGKPITGFPSLAEKIGVPRANKVRHWLNLNSEHEISSSHDGALIDFNRSDKGNAELFARHYGDRCRYLTDINRWAIWDGTRWNIEDQTQPLRLSQELVNDLQADARKFQDTEEVMRAMKWARTSGSSSHIHATLALAQPLLAQNHDTFDRCDYLFTCGSGTLDLQRGELREHRPGDLITLKSPISFNGSSTCPTFLHFLQEIFEGDQDLIAYVQRCVGYTLTADISQQCFFILHGEGANGKSTLITAISELLGEYAKSTPYQTLLAKRKNDNAIGNDLARLRGSRMIVATEGEEQDKLAESIIKRMTGGDIITARFLHGEFFDFRLVGKIWMATNHKPCINVQDPAMKRRVHLIPFKYTVPEAKRDPQLQGKLRDELPGILNWAIQGCREYLELGGLKRPEAVMIATKSYFEELDYIGQFIAEELIADKNTWTDTKQIRDVYERWADGSDAPAFEPRKVRRGLLAAGYTEKRKAKARGWQGVRIRSHDLEMFEDEDRSPNSVQSEDNECDIDTFRIDTDC